MPFNPRTHCQLIMWIQDLLLRDVTPPDDEAEYLET
jgi:hypothetical protein